MMTIKITGTGSSLPEKIVTNVDLQEIVETSDEWIRERTGIVQRHISTEDSVASLATLAAAKAIEQAGKTPEEVDMILVATCSAEMLLPNCACQVQANLGAKNAVAFDLNAACSGFLFGLQTAYAYIQTGFYKNAIIIGAEVLSKIMDWTDRSTCVLFGDGAGAAFIEVDEQDHRQRFLSFAQGADGAKGMVLSCDDRALANPYVEERKTINLYVQMNGQEVYRFATKQVPACIETALERANLKADDIDLYVLHQANIRIIEAVAKRLKVSMDKFPVNLDRVGNMSSATVPVLLDELNRAGKLKAADKIVMAGFGAGLTYGACVLEW